MTAFTRIGDKVSIDYGSHGRIVPFNLLVVGIEDQVYLTNHPTVTSGPDVLQFNILEIDGRPNDVLLDTVEFLTSNYFAG